MEYRDLEQIEEIGRGGMGIVYKAWSPGVNRWLVVKKLHPHLAGDLCYQKQLENEALSLSLLKHSHIVSFIDFRPIAFGENVSSGIVMDYIEGMNLKEWLIANGPPSFERLLTLFLEISSALSYLHQNNIFHLDLKPENILISHVGKPYLSDFGLASVQGELQNTSPLFGPVFGSLATNDGSATNPLVGPFGTFEYISPEQARGEPPDGRSDLYSLGMIFYTLIHGKSFFKGMEKTAVWGKIAYETYPFSLTFPSSIPPYFQAVIRKLIEKDPSCRFSDVRQMLDQVRMECNARPIRPSGRTKAILLKEFSVEKRVILAAGLVFIVVVFLTENMFDPPFLGRVQSSIRSVRPLDRSAHEPDGSLARNAQTTRSALRLSAIEFSIGRPETTDLINSDVPEIEIVYLKKEKDVDPPVSTPELNDHELEEFLMEFKRIVEQKDLAAIEKEARLPSSGREKFQEIFRDSRAINMVFQQIKREGASITVDFRVSPLIVRPSDLWIGRSQDPMDRSVPRPEGTLLFQDHTWHLRFSS